METVTLVDNAANASAGTVQCTIDGMVMDRGDVWRHCRIEHAHAEPIVVTLLPGQVVR